jgi:hypothetical protein
MSDQSGTFNGFYPNRNYGPYSEHRRTSELEDNLLKLSPKTLGPYELNDSKRNQPNPALNQASQRPSVLDEPDHVVESKDISLSPVSPSDNFRVG